MTEPDKTPERFARIRSAYLEAAKLSGRERDAYLEKTLDGDAGLLAEVRRLLASGDPDKLSVDGVIAEAAREVANEMTQRTDLKTAGPYRLLSTIGQGGMGRVYLAERDDGHFDQQVAIKIVDRNRATPELLARFRSERQILANLDHPNIARLFDGGETDEGVPYLVMELVNGMPVDQYCDEQRLSLRQRLDLFVDICSAVEYAHRRLVVHRDIKPSNILVTADGVPKLLDFGIAKLLSRDSIDYTMAATVGDMRVMTPRNASPEQIRGETITTATDIYALGLLLYQLLTGHFPYRATGTGVYELERLICETDPERPSVAITELSDPANPAASPEAISTARRVRTASQLRKMLKGDLDNIILVAMRKEPERRYATVRQLADDVRNYLDFQPVRARGDSLRYRGAKFLRRNAGGVALAAGAVAVVATLITVYTVRLAEERDRAALEAAKAQEVATFMTELFREADPRQSTGEPVSVVDMLDRGAARVQEELGDQPELQASLMATIGQSYHNMWDLNKTREHLESYLADAEAALGDDHPDVVRMRYVLGMSIAFQSDYTESMALHRKNYEIVVERHGRRSAEAALELHQIAFIKSRTDDLPGSETDFLEVIDIFRSLGPDHRSSLATSLMQFGTTLMEMGRYEEDVAMQQEALAIQRDIHGEQHPAYVGVLNNVGNAYMSMNRLSEARQIMEKNRRLNREIYGERSIPFGVATNNYATLLQRLGENDEALRLFREVVDIYGAGYGEDSQRFAYAVENLGGALEKAGDHVAAEEHYLRAVDILTPRFGADHVEVAITRSRIGGMLNEVGRHDDAIEQLNMAATAMTEAWGEAQYRTMSVRVELGRAFHALGRDDEAIASLMLALDASENGPDQLRFNRVRVLNMLASIHRDTGNAEAAEQRLREAVALWEEIGPVESPSLVIVYEAYATLLVEKGEGEAALSLIRERLAEFEDALGEDNSNTRRLREVLESLQ